jgi:quercetin dioxygenase-like cupin family protein
MNEPLRSRAVPTGKLAIFTAADAPTLDETGMMDAMTFTEQQADSTPISAAEIAKFGSSARLTVPFRQEGPGGFSLVSIEFAPGYMLPRHSHSSDCLYYIVEGSIVMGRRKLGPGDGFFLPAEQSYAYHAGPKGVKLLEFRNQVAFDMKVYEKDMAAYRARAFASMDSAGAEANVPAESADA